MADEPDRTDRLDVAVWGLTVSVVAWALRGLFHALHRPV